jgi:hypothetical protein
MNDKDLILAKLSMLSKEKQEQVINFIDFLSSKSIDMELHNEDLDWSKFSLSQAMMGMEDEVSLYSLDDLKEINKADYPLSRP